MSDGHDSAVTQCDECGALLDYPGNLWGRYERVCDSCYDRLEAMRR